MADFLERRFSLAARGTTVRIEALGGLTTFLTMAYIVFVNPAILSAAGLPFGAVAVGTALAAAVASIVMGVFANVPFALASGLSRWRSSCRSAWASGCSSRWSASARAGSS